MYVPCLPMYSPAHILNRESPGVRWGRNRFGCNSAWSIIGAWRPLFIVTMYQSKKKKSLNYSVLLTPKKALLEGRWKPPVGWFGTPIVLWNPILRSWILLLWALSLWAPAILPGENPTAAPLGRNPLWSPHHWADARNRKRWRQNSFLSMFIVNAFSAALF